MTPEQKERTLETAIEIGERNFDRMVTYVNAHRQLRKAVYESLRLIGSGRITDARDMLREALRAKP